MTFTDITTRVEATRDIADDDERAHIFEDDLYRDFIRYSARGQENNVSVLADMATLILSTKEIEFARWCA